MKYFICISGVDGSGKTTQCNLLYEYLLPKEPLYYTFGNAANGNPANRLTINFIKKYKLVLNNNQKQVIRSAFYMFLDIKQLTNNPEYQSKIVIMDRYVETIYAHAQLYGLDLEIISKIFNEVYVKPDVYLFLNLEPKLCDKRIRKRNTDIAEHEQLSNLIQLNKFYKRIVQRLDITVIDGNKTPLEIFKRISPYIKL